MITSRDKRNTPLERKLVLPVDQFFMLETLGRIKSDLDRYVSSFLGLRSVQSNPRLSSCRNDLHFL